MCSKCPAGTLTQTERWRMATPLTAGCNNNRMVQFSPQSTDSFCFSSARRHRYVSGKGTACIQPDLSLEDSRACCRQAVERILGGERSTTATTVRLSTRSFHGDGAATRHVRCFRSRRPEACDITGATGPQRGV